MSPTMRQSLLYLLVQCLLCHADDELKCSLINGRYWKQTWASEFDNQEDIEKWHVLGDSVGDCSNDAFEYKSCIMKDNFFITDGYAFLQVKHQNNNGVNYSSAGLYSRESFTYGRYEIRARLARGDFISSTMFAIGSGEGSTGQIDIVKYHQTRNIRRRVHYSNVSENGYATASYKFRSVAEAVVQLGQYFHLYGFEWYKDGVRFFYDDQYSKWINFTQNRNVSVWNNIRLEVGVGGTDFDQALPSSFRQMNWPCPAMIVDYVRIYTPFIGHDIRYCENVSTAHDSGEALVEAIKVDSFHCKSLKHTIDEHDEKQLTNTTNQIPNETKQSNSQFIVTGLLMLLIVAIIWMVVLLRRVHQKLSNNQTKNDSPPADIFSAIATDPDRASENDELYEEINDYYELPNEEYETYLHMQNLEQNDRSHMRYTLEPQK